MMKRYFFIAKQNQNQRIKFEKVGFDEMTLLPFSRNILRSKVNFGNSAM